MSASQHDVYTNLPLDGLGRGIRVLCIQPGRRNTPIRTSAKIVDLEARPREPYTTLSYTWGGQAKTCPIMLLDKEFLVTPNLYNALQHLRSPDNPLVIWVDAVCINQDDNKEKSAQVSMMDEIYRECDIVHMWLGCSEQAALPHQNPFALVQHFRDDKHFYELPGYRWNEQTVSWECDTKDPKFCHMMDAFMLLCNSTWWVRAWTAQEAILPKVAVFRYGDWTMPLDDFWTCQLNRIRHLGSQCCVVAYQATGDAPGPRASIDSVLTVVDCVKSIQDTKGPYKTLLDVYRRFGDRQCFDARDKIYSLLGFLSPSTPKIVPDYVRHPGEVYAEVFCTMIREKRFDLSCLLGEGFNSGEWNLPSWVPNFSGRYGPPGYFLTRSLRAYPLFAAGHRDGNIEILDERTLRLTGFQIDKVVAKSTRINSARASALGEILEDWRRTCRQNGIDVSTTYRDEQFCLLLAGGMTENLLTTKYRLLQENDVDLPTDAEWRNYMSLKSDRQSLPRAYRITVGCMVDRKALFVTASRRVGLSWPNVKVGDEVWLMDGAKTPFLLRKPMRTGDGPQRLLVGDVYVQGIMQGEGIIKDQKIEQVLLV